MKDITTVCPQDEVMAPDLPLQLTSPVHPHASYVGKPVFSPGASSVDSCYNTLSPGSANSPSMSFALSPSAPFYPSPSTSGNFVHSPNSSFAPSPSACGQFMSSPSSSASFGPPPVHSFKAASPSVPFVPSASTSFNPLVPASNFPFLDTVTVKQEPSELMSSLSSTSPHHPSLLSPRCMGGKRSMSPPPSPSGSMNIKRERPSSPGRTVSGNLLPPCRICLDKASGFHYGLNTCEACKGFFRRSLKRGASYVCTRDGKCDVTGERRNLCGYCRYQKCVSLGMSKTAIKTGRYTHAKRTRDTLEIKKMMRSETSLEEEDLDCEGIISHVVYHHDKHVICSTKKPKTFIDEQLKKKLDELSLQKELFGETGVSSDQHQEFLTVTGMELDNREALMNIHVSNSDRWIRGFIEFAKHVPGFRDLTLADQARLIKYARIEFWFLGSFPGYFPHLGLAVMPNGRCFTRKEMYTVWKEKYIDVSFGLSQTLKKLKVTPDELILIKTICLTAEGGLT
ncbi:retinoic acid receptor gamma-like isoform X2 [Littorina saxatilis]|uniref:retinoic acid receptor gamma-like isoform X2 n=1 Tax=Littorina saxatilis TaxID=31220 RepID=UPI0038B5DA93